MNSTTKHIPVLLKETIDGLNLRPGDTVVDATLGGAGHALEIAKRFGRDIHIVGIDVDGASLRRAEVKLKKIGAFYSLIHSNFQNLEKILGEKGITRVQGIYFDLGWSIDQFESGGRGFSFQKDEPLSMTLGDNAADYKFNAHQIVNEWDEENLRSIIESYGEESHAYRIAKGITTARANGTIRTSGQLAEIINSSVPKYYTWRRIHPATKTFQAIRITVNDELNVLKSSLGSAYNVLESGRMVEVISFHSLEDRIVKRTMRDWEVEEKGKMLTKRPITASSWETNLNPRSRSAKLRIFQKK